jgi:hypothetical protein
MELQKVKTELHKIIDEVKDEKLLISILRMLKNENEVHSDWSVSDSQKRELDIAYEESLDEKNLLDWEIVKQRLSQWQEK